MELVMNSSCFINPWFCIEINELIHFDDQSLRLQGIAQKLFCCCPTHSYHLMLLFMFVTQGDILEDPANEPKKDMYMMSVDPEDAPDKPE